VGGVTVRASSGALATDDTSFMVVHGPAAKIALTASASGDLASGSTRDLTATIQDAAGNTVTSGAGSTLAIAFAKAAGTGTVGGLGSSAASVGVATKTVTGGLLGSITIEATSGMLAQGAGNPLTFTVVAATSSVDLTVSPSSVQYSDRTTLSATVTPNDLGPGGIATGKVEFYAGSTKIGETTTITAGVATVSPQILLDPAGSPYQLKAKFISTNPQLTGGESTTKSLVLTPEDADATYTGDMLAFTAPGGSSATVQLRATVRDSSLWSSDADPGDITNATVTFKEGSTVLCGSLTVGAIDGGNTTGSAECQKSLSLGEHTITIFVNGYYVGVGEGVVEVSQPDGSFITGGGYTVTSNSIPKSAGQYAADPTSRINYGFNVKYTKTMKNLQGHLNVIFRRTVGGVLRTYQIKANAMDSLGIGLKTSGGTTCSGPPSSLCYGLADFRSKANLADITNPNSPQSLGGNLAAQVTMTDKGEPGKNDTIAVTLWQGSTLLFSSEWDGTKTLEKLVAGGNLVVH
jgi:hypothetical protein